MNIEQIIELIKTLGVPVAILIWIFWRLDYFMRYLIHKLDKFNDELGSVNLTLRDLLNLLKK